MHTVNQTPIFKKTSVVYENVQKVYQNNLQISSSEVQLFIPNCLENGSTKLNIFSFISTVFDLQFLHLVEVKSQK